MKLPSLTYGQISHLAAVAAVATLIGVGSIGSDIGLPLLAGLIGIGLPAPAGGSSGNP